MIDINLITRRREQRLRAAKYLRVSMLAALLFVCALCLTGIYFVWSVYRIKADIREVDSEFRKYRTDARKFEAYEKKIKELEPKIELLTSAQQSETHWCALLTFLSERIPESVWLSDLTSSRQTLQPSEKKKIEKHIVTFVGGSVNQRTIGDLIRNLNYSPFFPTPLELHKTNWDHQKHVFSFEIAGQLAKPIGSGGR